MEFQVGDKVVYPSQGVAVVESVSDEELAGTSMRCYTLKLIASDSLVMVPVNNSDRVGLRALTDAGEVSRVMKRLRTSDADEAHDWKDRYRANLDRIKTGDLEEIVDVLLCLAEVSSRKSLSFRERKMFDHARQLLVVEVSQVEARPMEEIEAEVDRALEQQAETS